MKSAPVFIQPYQTFPKRVKAPKTFQVTWFKDPNLRKLVREFALLLRIVTEDGYCEYPHTELAFNDRGEPVITAHLRNQPPDLIDEYAKELKPKEAKKE